MPLVVNLFSSYKKIALALETTEREMADEYRRREEGRLTAKLVEAGPVAEVILTGNQVDLTKLPIATYHEKDAGPYITLGSMAMKDPENDNRNVGIYRLMLKGKNKLGVQFSETAKAHVIHKKYDSMKKPLEVVITIGHHPALFLGSVATVPRGTDEYEVIGSMLGEPLELVKCKTIDLEAPAQAEIVLEGEIPPDIREVEAPFGEYPGTYGAQRLNPIIKIKAIMMRKNAIYLDNFVGHVDNLMLGGMGRLNAIYKSVKLAAPTMKRIHMPLSGRCRYICYIQLSKEKVEGEAKNAIFGAFAADSFLKYGVELTKT